MTDLFVTRFDQDVGQDFESEAFRYPLSATIVDFEAKLDALSGRVNQAGGGNGLYTLRQFMGHAGSDPINRVIVTPWFIGQTPPTQYDESSYIQVTILQSPGALTRSEGQFRPVGTTGRRNRFLDLEEIPFQVASGSPEYMKPLVLLVEAYWNSTGAGQPAWFNIKQLGVTIMFDGYRKWVTEQSKRDITENPINALRTYQGRR